MSDIKNENRSIGEEMANTVDEAPEVDPLASLKELLGDSPELKGTFDTIMKLFDDDSGSEETTEVECVEIDGHDYIIAKRIEVAGNTYLYLVNENDVMDFIIQKVIVEDDEEYITGLDSEKEFDLVHAYIQRDFLLDLKGKLKKSDNDSSSDK